MAIPQALATSLAIEPADFETGWFGQHSSLAAPMLYSATRTSR